MQPYTPLKLKPIKRSLTLRFTAEYKEFTINLCVCSHRYSDKFNRLRRKYINKFYNLMVFPQEIYGYLLRFFPPPLRFLPFLDLDFEGPMVDFCLRAVLDELSALS